MRYSYAWFSIAILLLSGCSGKISEKDDTVVHNVFVVKPQATGVEAVVELPGTVEEGRTISVGFKTPGQIEKIFVKEGDIVRQGQLLAVLDSKDYELGVATLREKFNNLKTENERQTKLHESGNMSDNDYEKAVSGLKQLELQLQLEENKLSYCRLISPSSGIVTKVNFENSEMVDAGTPVIELMDNSIMEIIVNLPVRLYTHRELFCEFYAESSALGDKRIKLNMLSLTPRADNTQLYRLRLSVPANSGLTPGMSVKVDIISEGSDNFGLKVPLSAVFDKEGRTYVWVVNPADSVINPCHVIVSGTGENGYVDIDSGLNPDAIVVRAGVSHLVDNEKVNIITEDSETNPGNLL